MHPIVMSIIMLFGGAGVFIAGMNMMSEGLNKSAGSGMKKLIGTVSNNRFSGVGIGAGVTAIIQSSAATTVMAIGFVNAGIMTLVQATPVIMGANIGTTITGVLVSLKSLGITEYAKILAFIGVMMMFFKNEKIKNIGSIIGGLGLIFVGLDLMSGAFDNAEFKSIIMQIFTAVDFPLLLILVGMALTALIQSSSALTGIVIVMAGSGALTIENALFIILGSNIGTCITAIIAGMGGNVNARRTAFIHLTFNVIGTIIFTAVIWPLQDKVVWLLQTIAPNEEMQVAWFHVIFNVTTTLILLPFVKQLVRLAELVIKDKPAKSKEKDKYKLKYVDELLLKTPAIALAQVKKEIDYMANLARDNIVLAEEALLTGDETYSKKIAKNEEIIDFTNKALTKFLIKLTSFATAEEEKVIGSYFHVLNDVERIGDHAENFYEIGEEMKAKELVFSDTAKEEIKAMYKSVLEMFDTAKNIFDTLDKSGLATLSAQEDVVDEHKKRLTESHVKRLATGSCSTDKSAYFFSTVAGLERVADHLVNVGYSIVNPTGSTSEQ